jgi:hypothetical protein
MKANLRTKDGLSAVKLERVRFLSFMVSVLFFSITSTAKSEGNLFSEFLVVHTQTLTPEKYKELLSTTAVVAVAKGPRGARFHLVTGSLQLDSGQLKILEEEYGETVHPAEHIFMDMEDERFTSRLLYRVENHYRLAAPDGYIPRTASTEDPRNLLICPSGLNKKDEACSYGFNPIGSGGGGFELEAFAVTRDRILVRAGETYWGGKMDRTDVVIFLVETDSGRLRRLNAELDSGNHTMGVGEGYGTSVEIKVADIDGDNRKDIRIDYLEDAMIDGFFHNDRWFAVFDANGWPITGDIQWDGAINTPPCTGEMLEAGDNEWLKVPVKIRNRREPVTWHPERWKGQRDLSFTTQACEDEKRLYFRVAVTDEKFVISEKLKDIHKDHVELWLDYTGPALTEEDMEYPKDGYYPEGQMQLGLTPSFGATVSVEVWNKQVMMDEEMFPGLVAPEEKWIPDPEKSIALYKKTKDGYIIIIGIFLPPQGSINGASVCVSDNDDPTKAWQETMMCTSPVRGGGDLIREKEKQ